MYFLQIKQLMFLKKQSSLTKLCSLKVNIPKESEKKQKHLSHHDVFANLHIPFFFIVWNDKFFSIFTVLEKRDNFPREKHFFVE